ncbi:MAG: hypothetical protein HWN65_01750 [Candidatus Helarchaeota archaeon]|nr:hypothetical protein [Candidatus Helarchaeota archaeon]
MKPKTRFLTALNHEEPDRVPLFGEAIDSVPVLKKYGGKSLSTLVSLAKAMRFVIGWKKIAGWLIRRPFFAKTVSKSFTKFMIKIGYDAVAVPVTLLYTKCHFPSSNQYVDEYGRQFVFSKVESGGKKVYMAFYERGYFDTEDPEAAYEEWHDPPLDPDHKIRRIAYEAAVKAAKDDIYAFPGTIGVLESTWEPFGFITFTKLLYTKPRFIERVFREHGDFMVALAENMMDLGAETFLILDDAGFKGRPFLSPKMYEKFVASQIKRVCDKVHSYDGKVLLHSCGNLYKILDLIIGAGVDGLHPWESTAGMDIFKAKEDYGEKLTLIGNVPLDMLTHKTPQDVEAYVKKLLQVCAPGGGYVLCSGHSITYSVSLENYEAMMETARNYGTYPISIE